MSLIPFHRLLIAGAILFSLGFAARQFVHYARDGGVSTLAIGVAFAVAGGALAVYLRHLRRVLGLADPQAKGPEQR